MKILFINRYFCEFSAGESLTYKTYEYFRNEGHEVFFFATNKKPYFIGDYKYEKFMPKDKFLFKEYLKNPISYYWDFEASKKLEQFLMLIKPDIIHVNQPLTMSIFSVLKKFNIPTVWTLHDSAIICGSSLKKGNKGFCKNFDCKNGNYINCLLNKCKDNKLEPSLRKTILGYVNYNFNSYDCVDKFITPSKALMELVLSSGLNLDKNKFEVINNFVEIPQDKVDKILDNNSYFLYIGRLVEEKGIQYILQAANELPRDIPFLIVGSGKYEKELKDYCKQNSLNNVEFYGYVHYDEVNKLYKNAIATIVPSNCFEVFGMVNIESFSNKTPVIGSNIGGIPEIIDKNANGLIFDAANINQLRSCILKYWGNKELAKQHGLIGYEKVVEKYSKQLYMEKLEKIYRNSVLMRK